MHRFHVREELISYRNIGRYLIDSGHLILGLNLRLSTVLMHVELMAVVWRGESKQVSNRAEAQTKVLR